MSKNRYAEEKTEHALRVLNKGEANCAELLRVLRTLEKVVKDTRLDFVFVRTEIYGRGHGKTGATKN
jgi:hypothetical protein